MARDKENRDMQGRFRAQHERDERKRRRLEKQRAEKAERAGQLEPSKVAGNPGPSPRARVRGFDGGLGVLDRPLVDDQCLDHARPERTRQRVDDGE